jgi:hypothetical protein
VFECFHGGFVDGSLRGYAFHRPLTTPTLQPGEPILRTPLLSPQAAHDHRQQHDEAGRHLVHVALHICQFKPF